MKPTPILTVTLVQSKLDWEDVASNIHHFSTLLGPIQSTDLIILPEMFTTGFTNNNKQFSIDDYNSAVSWMQSIAKEKSCVVTGSLIYKKENTYSNRLVWVTEDGVADFYDKKHLFSLAKENQYYKAGDERKLFTLKGWRICPNVCYDLRFPVWTRRVVSDFDYDMLLYVANWPAARIHAWTTLLAARAIENMSYVAGVNRVGEDDSNLSYPGHSAVIDPFGMPILDFEVNEQNVKSIQLDYELLTKSRNRFNFQQDADDYTLT